MARKTKPDLDPKIMDEVITSQDGTVRLRVILDLQKIQADRSIYEDALKYTRNIPFDLELVQASDPVALYVASERPKMVEKNPNYAVAMARAYYQKHTAQCVSDAVILAMLASPDNEEFLSTEPEPYDEAEEQAPPGILVIPEPIRDLSDPVEARLRCFFMVMEAHPEMVNLFYSIFNRAMANLAVSAKEYAKRDKAGFQPR